MYLKFLKILKYGQPKTDYTKRLTQSCVGKRVTAVLLEILSLFFFQKKMFKRKLTTLFYTVGPTIQTKKLHNFKYEKFQFFLPTMYYII